jgi:hypothetical protein
LQIEDIELPKASTVCSFVIFSYFLVTAGIAYDIINEPPAIGATQDPTTGTAQHSATCSIETHQQDRHSTAIAQPALLLLLQMY